MHIRKRHRQIATRNTERNKQVRSFRPASSIYKPKLLLAELTSRGEIVRQAEASVAQLCLFLLYRIIERIIRAVLRTLGDVPPTYA